MIFRDKTTFCTALFFVMSYLCNMFLSSITITRNRYTIQPVTSFSMQGKDRNLIHNAASLRFGGYIRYHVYIITTKTDSFLRHGREIHKDKHQNRKQLFVPFIAGIESTNYRCGAYTTHAQRRHSVCCNCNYLGRNNYSSL